MSGRTVAIMQPTYLPWIGYFDMMEQCDLFLFLDCVQFDRRSWQQRNRIKTANGETWLTVPVLSKGRRDQKICDVEIERGGDFPAKHVRTLQHAYGRAQARTPHLEDFSAVLEEPRTHLADLNVALIEHLRGAFGIATPTVRSSTLDGAGQRVERLVSLCEAVGATTYLSPRGSHGYIEEDNRFGKHGIELRYHAYEHPTYRQLHGDFVSHMSAVDLVLNEGADAGNILRSGRRPSCSHEELGAHQ